MIYFLLLNVFYIAPKQFYYSKAENRIHSDYFKFTLLCRYVFVQYTMTDKTPTEGETSLSLAIETLTKIMIAA